MHFSESAEWFTADLILNPAKRVLGHIDLDPASCEAANARVGASKYFTKEEDGLAQLWHPHGKRIFINPPGDKRGVLPKAFWTRLYLEYCAGLVDAGIYVGFSLEQLRYLPNIGFASIAIIKQRVKYMRPDGSIGNSPAHGSFVAFLGKEEYGQRFYSEFRDISNVVFL